jgi:hypothetical protein
MSMQLRSLIVVVSAGGLAVLLLGLTQPTDQDIKLLLVLAGLGILAERYAVGLFSSYVSVGAAAVLVAAIVAGIWGVAVVAPVVVLGGEFGSPTLWYKRLFNVAVYVLAGATFTGIFAGLEDAGLPQHWPQVLAPGLSGALANFLLNTGLVAAAISLNDRRSWTGVWRENYAWLLPQYVVLGLASTACASAYEIMGLWAIAVFAAPIAGVRHAYRLAARRAREHTEALPEAA